MRANKLPMSAIYVLVNAGDCFLYQGSQQISVSS